MYTLACITRTLKKLTFIYLTPWAYIMSILPIGSSLIDMDSVEQILDK
jgi:hypothetical protein